MPGKTGCGAATLESANPNIGPGADAPLPRRYVVLLDHDLQQRGSGLLSHQTNMYQFGPVSNARWALSPGQISKQGARQGNDSGGPAPGPLATIPAGWRAC